MRDYHLKERDCSKPVSNIHLEKISRSLCRDWKRLPPYLKLESTIVADIKSSSDSEKDKRHAFFSEWKVVKGSDATYKALIGALLEIGSKQDAESICKMLQVKRRKLETGSLLFYSGSYSKLDLSPVTTSLLCRMITEVKGLDTV